MSDTTKDLFLYGGLAIGAYFIVKKLTDPLVKPITEVSDALTTGVQTVSEAPQQLFDTQRQAAKNIYYTYNTDYKTVTSGAGAVKNLFSTPNDNLMKSAAVSKMGMSAQEAKDFYGKIQNPLLASSVTTEKQKVSNAIKTIAIYSSPAIVVGKGIKAVGSAVLSKASGLFKGATVKATIKPKYSKPY